MAFFKSWLLIAFYSIACMGMGILASWLLSLIFKAKSEINQNIFIVFAANMIVGVALLGILWTFVSLSSLFSPLVVLFVLLPFFLFGIWNLVKNRIRLKNDIQFIWFQIARVGWTYKLIGLGGIYFIFVIISNNFIVGPNDASAYYFALAKVIASSHTLKSLPGYYFSTFPSEAIMALGLHGELHMAALHSLGTGHYARYFDISLLIASIVTLLGFLSMAGVRVKGLFIAALIVLCTSSIMNITAIGKVDIYGVTFTLGAIYFAGAFFFNNSKVSLSYCGLLIGTAITTKFSYLVNMFPALIVLVLWNSMLYPLFSNRAHIVATFKLHFKEIAATVLILSGAILFSMISYFVKNQILLGFFAAPFFLPQEVLKQISILFPDNTINKIVLSYPLALSFFDIPANPGHFSPLLIALLPNLYFARKCFKLNTLGAASFISGLVGVFLWVLFFPGVPFVRYIFAALVLLFPFVLLATEYVLESPAFSILRTSIQGCLLLAVFFNLINPANIGSQINQVVAFANGSSHECAFSQCDQDVVINENTARGDRLLNLSDFRYWLRSDLIQCSATTEETIKILTAPEDKFWETAYQFGIKYVSLNIPSKGLKDPIYNIPPKWMKINQLYRKGQLIVYRIDVNAPPYSPSKSCVQIQPPAWEIRDTAK